MRLQFASPILVFFFLSAPANAKDEPFSVKSRIELLKNTDYSAKIIVELKSQAPIRINKEAPISLHLQKGEGLLFGIKTFSQKDGVFQADHMLKWEIAVSTLPSKKQSFSATIGFYLCSEKWCRKYDAKIKEQSNFSIVSNLT